VELLCVDLHKERDNCKEGNDDDVPRQWHLRGARGDSYSTYRNEERSSMVFACTPG
jgi:hypothetical protein